MASLESVSLAAPESGGSGRGVVRRHHGEFDPRALCEHRRASGVRIEVCIPARDEAATISEIVSRVRGPWMDELDLVDELLVVDDGSKDDTGELARRAGARVVNGAGLGKGEAMRLGTGALRSWRAAANDTIVVFLDGDVVDFAPHFVTGLVGPLIEDPSLELVKGCYERALGDSPTGGGRVTELVAKPALELVFPELASVLQPLAGETAVRDRTLRRLELAGGYAVEVRMLIDVFERFGIGAIAEVDLGHRRHRNRELSALVPQARSVLSAILGSAILGSAISGERLAR